MDMFKQAKVNPPATPPGMDDTLLQSASSEYNSEHSGGNKPHHMNLW